MKLILALSFLFFVTGAFATQLAISSVSTLNPNPNVYTITDSNNKAFVQSVSIQNSGQDLIVNIQVYCQRNTPVKAQVSVYDAAGTLISQSQITKIINNCNGGTSATGSITLNPVQISQVAKVSVNLS